MRKRRPVVVLAGALLLAIAAAVLIARLTCQGVGGGPDAFDGDSAFELVERQVAFGPRVPNTPAHDRALAFFREYLAARADTVSVAEFTHVPIQGDTLRLANVMASFAPDARSRVLIAAHWDTRPVANKDADSASRRRPIQGANDGGSGVAVLLTIAEVLAKRPPPAGYGVDLLLLDGEDYGHDPQTLEARGEDMYLGAKHFARTNPSYRPLFGILLDLVGDKTPLFLQEGYSLDYAPEVVRRVWTAARDLGYGAFFQERPLGYITDDHLYLNQAGIRTIDLIDFDYPAWHTHGDMPSNLSPRTLDMVGEVLLEVIYNRI